MAKTKEDPNKERKEALTKAVNELQKVFEFEPAMKPKGESEMGLEKMIKEAVENINVEEDQEELAELSEETVAVLVELGLEYSAEEEEAEEQPKAKTKAPAEKAEKKPAKEKAPKKDAGPSMASFMDETIAKGGTWEELIEAFSAESEKRGAPKKYTVGAIKSHINFRNKDGKWLSDRGLSVTEEGVVTGSAKKVEKAAAPAKKKVPAKA